MAFLNKLGGMLKQSVSKQIGIGSQISASNPSIYQALRCMSSSKVFVGGLPYTIDDSSLRDAFSQYGEVHEAKVIIDREQNRSRGFGFVTFASTEEASSAIQALDGQELQGRRVKVDYAAERAPRSYGGGGGYGGGGYGGGYGGGGGGYGGGGGGYGGGGGGYGHQQNYGGDGGYGGGSGGGFNQGVGAGAGDAFFGGGAAGADSPPADTGYGGGSGGGFNQGVGAGAGDAFFGGGAAGADSPPADTGFPSSDSGFRSDSVGSVGNEAGNFDLGGPPDGNFGDDEPSDFVKRA